MGNRTEHNAQNQKSNKIKQETQYKLKTLYVFLGHSLNDPENLTETH